LNQRKWPRFNLVLSVQVRFQQRTDMTTTRTLNISRSGLFLALERPRPIGTPVRINLSIADSGEQFALEGIVVHRQPDENQPLAPGATAGVGVFLTSVSPEYERFCAELAVEKAAPGGDKAPRRDPSGDAARPRWFR
jgi:Tfp pilus assembly protein PilZ